MGRAAPPQQCWPTPLREDLDFRVTHTPCKSRTVTCKRQRPQNRGIVGRIHLLPTDSNHKNQRPPRFRESWALLHAQHMDSFNAHANPETKQFLLSLYR